VVVLEWIDSIVVGLVEEYETRNVYELCEALEIEIRIVDPSNIMLHSCKSHYYRYFDDREIIFIDKTIEEGPEKDFILKHELGHALCNAEILSAAYSNNNLGKAERQANYFAIQLSNLEFDEIMMHQMTYEQIAAYLDLPYEQVGDILENKFSSIKNTKL
jgi:Zn-dependent peptidase ImmA (M78 family)